MNDFKEKAGKSGVTRKEINDAVSITGGLDFTRTVVRKYYKKYMRIVDEMELTENKRENLISVLDKASRLSK
jgi:heptaprenyl diphosphate synthase